MTGASGTSTLRKGRILCVDDDQGVLKVLAALLGACGYDVVQATDGGQGVELFRQNKKDLVAAILDLRLPVKNGFEVAKEIKAELPALPLIALSAYLGRAQHDGIPLLQCQEAGFDAYTTKPFSIEPFMKTINECVAQYVEKRGTRKTV